MPGQHFVGSFLVVEAYVGFAFFRASPRAVANVAGGGLLVPAALVRYETKSKNKDKKRPTGDLTGD